MNNKSLANLLKIISTERRMDLLGVLLQADGPINASIVATMSNQTASTCAFNLMAMAEVGIVMRQQSGRFVFYAVNRKLVREIFDHFRVETEEGELDVS